MRIPLLIIAGPTGSGKTDTAVFTAQALDGEVLTADSMQVYRGMDIGTAKPTLEERRGVPHHLIDIVAPDAEFSVTEYVARADEIIADIHRRGKAPIVAGGTGFYIQALVDRWTFPPQPADMAFREAQQHAAQVHGPEWLHAQLTAVDAVSASRLHPHDVKRVVRALEVFHLTGRPLSSFAYKPGDDAPESPYAARWFGLTVPRDLLYTRLETRVHTQLEAGLLEEVRRLDEAGYGPELSSMKGITYRQLQGYLRGEYDFATAVALMVRDNRRYAKRQYTWFNADPRFRWIDMIDAGSAVAAAARIVREWNAQLNDDDA